MDRGPTPLGDGFWRDASGRFTFDVYAIDSLEYPATCRAISDSFALTPDGLPVIGLDEMFWNFRRGDAVVALDWDIWMGFMVVAQAPCAEPLVREIADWLRSSRRGEKPAR